MPDPHVLIVTAMRDEGPNLIDWIAHQRAAGAGAVLVYTNDCTDGTDTLLDLLAGQGVIHVPNVVPTGKTPQWAALRQAARHPAMDRADWVAVLDCDEYLNLRAPMGTFGDLIARVGPAADAVALPWRLFGHAGHALRPDAPARTAFRRAIPPDALYPALARYIKTLYRRDAFKAPGVHRPRQDGPAAWVDGSGRPLPDDFAATQGRILLWGDPLASDLVQLNHYSVRSAAEFLLKRRRGLPNHTDKRVDLTYWVERNFNAHGDDSIARMAPATDAEAARLRALPGVRQVEAASRAHHDTVLQSLLREPETVQLYGRLLLAAGSTAPDAATARQLARLYQRAGH